MSITNASAIAEVEAEICAIAGAMANQEQRLLHLIGEIDAVEGWRPTGKMTCAHWLADLLDIEVSTAREKVRVARALRELPSLRARFEAGELSYAKVREVTRVATTANEDELGELAVVHPAGRLPRVLAAWQQRNDPEGLEERAKEDRGVSFRDEATGNRTMTAELSLDLTTTLETLIDFEVANAPAGALEHRTTLRHKRADAFGRLIEQMAAGGASAGASGSRLRPELILHRRVGETALPGGSVLPRAVARHFSCDCDVRVMTHFPDGSPADVGRRHRIVTRPLRLLVLERDGYRCQFPGCDARHYLEVHHIVHWEDGGPTVIANLITYCGYHHRFVHKDERHRHKVTPVL